MRRPASAKAERDPGGAASAPAGDGGHERPRSVVQAAARRRGRLFRMLGGALVVAGLAVAAPEGSWAAPPTRAAPLRAGVDRSAVEAARRFLCPQGGAPMRGRCRPGAAAGGAGREASARGWDTGLPAPARRQSLCPEGTVRSRVLLWDDAVRCVPQ